MANTSFVSVTDIFCGAGGSSLGAALAGGEIRTALNHWDRAITTHAANFPQALHERVDVSESNPKRWRPTTFLLGSPSCDEHTDANGKTRADRDQLGGQLALWEDGAPDPQAERSRATMWDIVRFADAHNMAYEFIIVENVLEARRWRCWQAWWDALTQGLGYQGVALSINSQFVPPTPQSRDRLYCVFWRPHHPAPDLRLTPAAWCEYCEAEVAAGQVWKRDRTWGDYNRQYVYCCPVCDRVVRPRYEPAATCIDWTVPTPRIGDRPRPLAPATRARVQAGLDKWSADPTWGQLAAPAFVMDTAYRHAAHAGRVRPLSAPLHTLTTQNNYGFVGLPPYLVQLNGTSTALPLARPMPTQLAGGNHHALVAPPPFLVEYYGTGEAAPLNAPLGTVTTRDRFGLVTPPADVTVEDCGFRMLQPHEVGAAMAFPADYVVTGTKAEQVTQYGQAVTPPVMRLLMERCLAVLQ